ncbi:Antibacterial factor-related peptide 1 [Caenorhabditis elegans]|uniref:Antibacterial factor-related peptide 1 n=2 Tax=Caenorhabditis elegans TaxID=6239 RepID=ABF1_CAEEL|nr:Antibacterial factor-related peptide 1 [Caenorhabditis elegans]G5EGC4.1 RecName: Full=Antibacterial factor-related peptide 1; Flags: Precursor [Caenorhabditis elegans]BAA89489.1 ABF-1 [Caenorhabditis elegans]CCD67777.1 Antibacterial factor-related peptide 1 [Caenorhabditis elegans]|eukprot:NP_491253.1 Antibacterial factor-related peptide 1 [Caenorhabditis elegans]
MLYFCLLLVLLLPNNGVSSEASCARMDVPVMQRIAQGLCTSSCTAQKCMTGICKKVDSHPTCFCGGCSNANDVSLDTLISQLPHN